MNWLTQAVLFLGLVMIYFSSSAQPYPVINEIMANPGSSTLPNHEWIELYNPTNTPIRLANYSLVYNDREFPLPGIFLSARQYLILTAAQYADTFERFGNVHGLAPWPTLNNTGAIIGLRHHEDGMVDEVRYSNRWYHTALKRSGGWSLERINPGFRCNPSSNWAESEALQGGTPGGRNSVFDETHIPNIGIAQAIVSGAEIRFVFNMEVEDAVAIDAVRSEPDIGRILLNVLRGDTVIVTLPQPLPQDVAYTFELIGTFCEANFLSEYTVFVASETDFNDVVINEILFNPKPDGVDFVEIYNRSGKTINLQHWRLGNRLLSSELCLFAPDSYYVITTNTNIVQQHYPGAMLDQSIVLPSLPAYANQQGFVTLFDGDEKLIDSLHYQASMHQSFINNPRGISLERQSADMDTNAPYNFTSASTYSEGATPGYENSKDQEQKAEKSKIFLSSKTFSPDGDGVEDELIILYDFAEENGMVNLYIYNDSGRLINRLIRNQSVGFTGQFTWDGKMEGGSEAPAGIYLCVVEMYTDSGHHRIFRESCVLVRRGQGY